eukprot:TRINITY_DN1475_c0_g1_i1.p1 TRINITY_DN1475_c0_g1~~TRINITY_DN1475_c0_g1_i1.p1  ORF type:complete len:122 (-),score=4.88 TRINITY_DN1475_c0_g1_i1:60-425(-)
MTLSAPYSETFLVLFLISIVAHLVLFIIDKIFVRTFKYSFGKLFFGTITAAIIALSFFILAVLLQETVIFLLYFYDGSYRTENQIIDWIVKPGINVVGSIFFIGRSFQIFGKFVALSIYSR